MTAKTLFEKVWERHVVVPETADTPAVLYVDLHLIHEVTSPQAFTVLRERGLKVRRPDRTLAPWTTRRRPTRRRSSAARRSRSSPRPTQIRQLERNCADFGIELIGLQDDRRGIVHVIGPELGARSRARRSSAATATPAPTARSARSPSASAPREVGHVLATQCLLQRKPKTLAIEVTDRLAPGVTAKDLILAIIGRIGVDGGTGHVIEYRGDGDPRALHGGAHDRLQHVHRGRRAGRHGRARRDHLRLPAGPTARPAGRRLGTRRRRLAHAADRRGRALRPGRPARRRGRSSR